MPPEPWPRRRRHLPRAPRQRVRDQGELLHRAVGRRRCVLQLRQTSGGPEHAVRGRCVLYPFTITVGRRLRPCSSVWKHFCLANTPGRRHTQANCTSQDLDFARGTAAAVWSRSPAEACIPQDNASPSRPLSLCLASCVRAHVVAGERDVCGRAVRIVECGGGIVQLSRHAPVR